MRRKNAIRGLFFATVICKLFLLFGCQTTRLPKAVRSADNKSLILQVSEDSGSLMWNGGKRVENEVFSRMNSAPKSTVDPASLQMRAELLLVGRQTRSASDNARLVLRRDLRNVRALKILIKSALIERKPHEVIALCQIAQEHSPQDAELISLEGLAHYQLGNSVTAKILWNRALVLDPVHIPTLMNMGVFLLNNGHYRRAGAHFDKVIAIQAEHSDALVGRALVMSAEGRANEASTALEEVLRKNGDSALVLTLLTQITREHLKDYTRAARYVERMLALQNSDRRTLEQAVTMKQELKRLMETNSKNYSDENLRKMADHSPAASHQAAREVTSAQSDSQNDELHKLEESIK